MFDRLKQRLLQSLDLPRIAGRADDAADTVAHHEVAITRIDAESTARDMRLADADVRFDALHQWMRIEQTTAWVRSAPLTHRPTISVVMPTRNRVDRLASAVETVLSQSYPSWELVVIDDGSADGTANYLTDLAADDERVRAMRSEGVGASAARNVGLAAATGSWIAFLDDDNTMHPDWLRAIAEYSGRTPGCLAMHGAQMRDDVRGGDEAPWLLYFPERTLDDLRHDNTIDLGMLAVKADHPELHFNEDLRMYEDWDLAVRLWEHDPIASFPALSGFYSTSAPGRVTHGEHSTSLDAMRTRFVELADVQKPAIKGP